MSLALTAKAWQQKIGTQNMGNRLWDKNYFTSNFVYYRENLISPQYFQMNPMSIMLF